jgi:uncharacterized protein (DUF1015 family)
MARIYPFRALRYDTAKIRMEDVVTQPYDKITPAMQQAYYDRSKYNLIRVILGKKEADDTDAFAPDAASTPQHNVYSRAAESLTSWRKKGILREESEPALYGYSQTYTVPGTSAENPETRERRGFIALGHLYDYADQVVYRHEQTFPKHKSDRLALFKATRAYCEQIYMLYADPAFTAEKLIFGSAGGTGEPAAPADLQITDEYNVVHRVWRLTDPHLINLIVTAMADKKLIIADGHHRYETSVTYMHERAAELGLSSPSSLPSRSHPPLSSPSPPPLSSPSTPPLSFRSEAEEPAFASVSSQDEDEDEDESPSTPADEPHSLLPRPAFPEAAMMMTFVNMEAPGITILPTHRVVSGIERFSSPDFITKASALFEVEELPSSAEAPTLLARLNETPGDSLIAATGDGNYLLTPKPEAIAPLLASQPPRQRDLGVVLLHTVVLDHLLGLDAETVTRTGNVRYLREAPEALSLVQSGQADIAFLIKPVTLAQLRDISLSGEVMPQKSTDFYPKLLSGLAIYALD